ncbi:MAG TPA: restriction endonuclease [Halothiobacillus sp.]|nr:restriction endonuclease [Halothiobacillus sp.]
MARRKQSGFEDLIELASRLPWWAGVAVAVVAYLVLHPIAIREIAVSGDIKMIGASVAAQIFKTAATIGQYLLPVAFLIGSVVSVFKRRKRNQLVEQTQARGKQSALLDMSWREFEMLVGEAFRRRGFTVEETGGNGPDGGVDLVLRKGREIHLVQCKQWKALKVGVDVVRQLYGVMAAKGATGGFVVTSGQFSADAKAFAEGQNIELIEGKQLLAMIQTAKASGVAATATMVQPMVKKDIEKVDSAPACPRCGGSMVRRVARQGSNAGNAFWGCSTYPKCRGVTAIDQ